MCALVSRSWKAWAYQKAFELGEEEEICDENQWKKFIGDPGIQPYLPLKVFKEYDKNTHLLTFIPVTIDGQPLTINRMESLVRHPKNEGHATKYDEDDFWECIFMQYGNEPNGKAHWLLLKKDIFEGTRNKSYDVQTGIVEAQGMKVPELFGTIVSVFMRYVGKGEHVYKAEEGNQLQTCTRVKETIGDGKIVVGGFSATGLQVFPNYYRDMFGMAGGRKSFVT